MDIDSPSSIALSINSREFLTSFTGVLTPSSASKDAIDHVPASKLVYSSVGLALLQAVQFGWSSSQVNLSTFHSRADCGARPIVPGTCLMFPGHSASEWLYVVNAWIVGGMIGALSCGRLADRFGRKSTLIANAVLMILSATIQASAPSVHVFVVGRALAGLASGTATATCNGYVSEVALPHIRSTLGGFYGVAISSGLFLISITFFFFDTSSGWRFIAGFPIVIGTAFLVCCWNHLVESPAWLLLQGRQTEAEHVLARLYGPENVAVALQWLQPAHSEQSGSVTEDEALHPMQIESISPFRELFSLRYRSQLLLTMHFAWAAQLTGINAVFFYSSMFFKTAGLRDGRIGNLIVSVVYLIPTFFVATLSSKFGNRTVMLVSQLSMLLAAVGLTIALSFHISTLSIVFVSLFGASFSGGIGSLAFPTAASIFPDTVRATGMSLMMMMNWCGSLVIGICFPYISSALAELAFVPFIGTLVYFLVFMYKFLPTTTNKTTDEIQQFFRS